MPLPLTEGEFLERFTLEELAGKGIDSKSLGELKNDPYQVTSQSTYLGAMVINFLGRTGKINGGLEGVSVPLIPLAGELRTDISDILAIKSGGNPIVFEKPVGGDKDLFIHVTNLHMITEDGLAGRKIKKTSAGFISEVNRLANEYAHTRNPAIKNELASHASKVVNYVLPGLIKRGIVIIDDREGTMGSGVMGYLEAIDRYKGMGASFITFAKIRITGAIIDDLRTNSPFSRTEMRIKRELRVYHDNYVSSLGNEPSFDDYMAFWNEQAGKNPRLYTPNRATSLHSLIYSDGLHLNIDNLTETSDSRQGDEGGSDPLSLLLVKERKNELTRALEADLGRLPEKYRGPISTYICDGVSLQALGEMLGVSESRASQIVTGYVKNPDYFLATKQALGLVK